LRRHRPPMVSLRSTLSLRRDSHTCMGRIVRHWNVGYIGCTGSRASQRGLLSQTIELLLEFETMGIAGSESTMESRWDPSYMVALAMENVGARRWRDRDRVGGAHFPVDCSVGSNAVPPPELVRRKSVPRTLPLGHLRSVTAEKRRNCHHRWTHGKPRVGALTAPHLRPPS
jgi:hypothetical protein